MVRLRRVTGAGMGWLKRALNTLCVFGFVHCAAAPAPPPASSGSGPQAGGASATGSRGTAAARAHAPAGRREPIIDELFGVPVADPYRWLEDEKSADVKDWMQAHDRRTREYLANLPDRSALTARLRELLYVESRSAPSKYGNRLFFMRRAKEQEKSVVYWQEGEKGDAKVLIDPNTMSADGSVSLGSFSPSWDGKKVAYMLRGNNADESTLHVLEVDSGKESEIDVIEGLRYTDASWSADGRGFYYTWLPRDPSIPPNQRMGEAELRYHVLGTDPKTDTMVRGKTGDATRWMQASSSRDGKYLVLSIYHGWSEADVYVLFPKGRHRGKPSDWKPLAVGTKALYSIETWKDRFYIATNDGAPRWHILSAPGNRLDRRAWTEIVPEDPSAVLDKMTIVGGHLGLSYLKNASTELQVRTLAGKLVRTVPLPALGSASSLVGTEEDDAAYFSFSSYVFPEEIYRTSVKAGKTEVFAKVEVPVDPSKFELEQVWYPSKDKTSISMFILHKKGFERNGSNPTILYGYGGFNVSLTPRFAATFYPWLERGGVYAIPNLRGGGEYGEAWHKAGMLGNKQNVFDDFIGAAEWLVRERYTRPDRLAAMGRSNGGLLVGAAMTQRPDLFGAIVCGVPLLDMIRYHKFGIGQAWVPEYGNPEDPEQFKVLIGYSPYHRVQPSTAYPALLMMSADSDDRVDPMHARKFTAAIEAASIGRGVSLLRIESNAGHGGADLRNKAVEQASDELAFLLAEIGTRAQESIGPSNAH